MVDFLISGRELCEVGNEKVIKVATFLPQDSLVTLRGSGGGLNFENSTLQVFFFDEKIQDVESSFTFAKNTRHDEKALLCS